jgi:hypothetical protein
VWFVDAMQEYARMARPVAAGIKPLIIFELIVQRRHATMPDTCFSMGSGNREYRAETGATKSDYASNTDRYKDLTIFLHCF